MGRNDGGEKVGQRYKEKNTQAGEEEARKRRTNSSQKQTRKQRKSGTQRVGRGISRDSRSASHLQRSTDKLELITVRLTDTSTWLGRRGRGDPRWEGWCPGRVM